MGKEEDKLMQDELLQMNQSVYEPEGESSTDAPSTDSPKTENPSTNAPTTDMPEEFDTESPSTDASSTDAPTTDAPDELALLRAENLQLKADRDKPSSTKAPSTTTPATEAPFTSEDFLGDVDLDELTRDPEKFNELLNSVLKKGMEMARGITTTGNETVLKSIPDIVKTNLTIITSLKKASDQFYADNEDLKPWKQAVSAVFEEVIAKNPDKTMDENLGITGDEVRKRLKLKEIAVKKEKDKKAPNLPSNKGGPRPKAKPKTEGIEAEIADMNKSI